MDKEEILNQIKEKVDTLSTRAYEIINNNEEKFTKSDFVMYCDVHNLFRKLDGLIECKNDIYNDYCLKYLNCMGHFQENKVKEFIDVSNEVRPLLEDPTFIAERDKSFLEKIVVKGYYNKTNSVPNLPKGAESYSFQFSNTTNSTYIKREIGMDEKLPFGSNEVVYNMVQAKINGEQKILGVGFGTTKVNNYKYVYYLLCRMPMMIGSVLLQIVMQFEVEGKTLEVNFMISDMISKRLVDFKTKPENINASEEVLFKHILEESLDKDYPDDAVSVFRQAFRDIIEIN